MNIAKPFGIAGTCLCLLLASLCVRGQGTEWKDRVDRTFVFEIGSREAEELLRSDQRDSLILTILHTQVADFGEHWDDMPAQGHFIFARIVQNRVEYEYVPVVPFQVFLYKEYGVLALQVADAGGNIRRDARVRIRGGWRLFDTRVHFDPESQTYRINDASGKKNRFMTIELDGFTAIFDLTKHFVPPWYGGGRRATSPDFYSYMLTDKNRYKPGESVRFKSYALTGGRRPLRKELEVWLDTDTRRFRKISTLTPYNPGGYAGEIVLHDSLEMKLDRNYFIQLREPQGRVVARRSFKYEDYVLYDNTLEVELQDSVHYFPAANRVEISATDANGLFLPDARADVAVLRRSVGHSYTEILSLPDTLYFERIMLENGAPTTLEIPASVFGEADGVYEVQATVITFDGQRMTAGDMALFFRSHRLIEAATHGDTLRFEYLESGKPAEAEAELFYDGEATGRRVALPYGEPFDQARREYRFRIAGTDFEQRILTRDIDPLLDLEGGIRSDSFNVRTVNPLALEFSWYIYQGGALVGKGSGREMDFDLPATDMDKVHYVEIFYSMGNEEQVFRRTFAPRTEFLSVETDLPGRIFPGQRVEATVTVRDFLGKPVRNADLTAMAWNSLLDYRVPDLPYYGPQPQGREQRSSYSINRSDYRFTMPLDYGFWRGRAGLDTLLYYRLAYPGGLFRHEAATPDGVTQFAPYVMKDGAAVDIYVIEDNGRPVYFSWTEQPQGYSFPVDAAKKHKITLRLHDRALVIDSLVFVPGRKTTLSLDADRLPPGVRTVSLEHRNKDGHYTVNRTEAERYSKLIARLPVPIDTREPLFFRYRYDSLLVYHPLQNDRRYRGGILAGPVPNVYGSYDHSVTYRHEGGYRYDFEDNVVYKYPVKVYPDSLSFTSQARIGTLDDFHLSPAVLRQKEEEIGRRMNYWHPSNIYIVQPGLNLNFRLPPERTDSVGVANLLLVDRGNGRMIYPDRRERERRLYPEIAPGSYDMILLYNDAGYLRRDGVGLWANTYTEVNSGDWPLHPADSLSVRWLKAYDLPGMIGENRPPTPADVRRLSLIRRTGMQYGNMVNGFVSDTGGEPLPGATIMLKGTQYGTVSDVDGYFEIDTDPSHRTLVVSYIGFENKELTVAPGSMAHVVMEESMMTIEDVVVTGIYGSNSQSYTGSVSIVHNESLARAPGEALPGEPKREEIGEDAEAEQRLYRELLALGGLRSNFSDVGFWEPVLVTDRHGKASFEVTFPDNITRWDAVVYAMNRRLQTGTWRRSIRSYKPLMAELRMPQFLVAGDTSRFAANIRNYTSDASIEGDELFVLNADTLMRRPVEFTSSHSGRMEVAAPEADSLTAAYLFTRTDGYTDGERRSIAILPVGTEVAEGTLGFLRDGERIDLSAGENETVELIVTGNQLDVYLNAANYLHGYEYACNEQLASKLIGLLNLRLYDRYNGRDFKHDRQVNSLVRRLLDNRNDDWLWSWWGCSPSTSHWMSAHIMRALKMAGEHGYNVDLDPDGMADNYFDVDGYRNRSIYDIEILHALSSWGVEQPYGPAVEYWEEVIRESERQHAEESRRRGRKPTQSWLAEKLLLWEIRQREGLGFEPDSVARYLKKDVLGAVYCDDGIERSWYGDALTTTLTAYRIVRQDPSLRHNLEAMQMYILGTRQSGWNTYQSAGALATVFPDLLASSSTAKAPATLRLTGKEERTVTGFPYRAKLAPGERLGVEKQKGMPLIWAAWTTGMRTEARTGEAFDIAARLSGDGHFRVGEIDTLVVTVRVKQANADHVMIEVPIPAGCDYASRAQVRLWRGPEVHREHFKEKAVIFCERMPEGEYTFRIELLPRYSGRYTVNPAKVELMYFPVVSSNNGVRRMEIE